MCPSFTLEDTYIQTSEDKIYKFIWYEKPQKGGNIVNLVCFPPDRGLSKCLSARK